MTETRDPNQLMDVAPDIAPLAWVIDEIRTSLMQAIEGVRGFLGVKQDLDSLRSAANQVHQAHGALQLLDLRGVALVTEAIEQLLRRWEQDPRDCQPAAVRSIESAIAAVLAYLDGLLAGRPNQPIRLFPYFRDVLMLNHATRVHPADLMFPDLTRRPAFHQIETRALTSDQLRVRRVRFEEGLLGFLRDAENPRARRKMREALGDLEMLPQRGLARSLWWVVRGLLEALDAREVPVDTDLKRVLARLNLQLRRLIDGVGGVAERLMVDALYYVGRAGEGAGARAAEIKRLYGLPALIPADFERATLTTLDAEAQRLLKEALTQCKNLWGQIVGGGPNAAGDSAAFATEIAQVRAAAARLTAVDIDRVLAVLTEVTRDFAQLPPAVREPLALEVASALLFLELGADQLPHEDAEYGHRATQVCERLQTARAGTALPDSAPWLSALARRAQDRLTMTTVVAETQTTLREIEQRLDRFFRNPADRSDLAPTLPMFDQVCGVLSVLGFADPVAALRSVQESVRSFADPATRVQPSEFTRIAGNLGAVGFFIESLGQDSDRPRGMFRFDPAAGVFSADLTQVRSAEAVTAPQDDLSQQQPVSPLPEPRRTDNVEAEALRHVDIAHALAQRLVAKSSDNATLEELARLLPRLASEADLLDDAALKERVARAAVLTTQFGATRDPALMRDLAALLAPPTAPAVELTAPLPESQDETDRELHDIFVEEAQEVLGTIESHLGALRDAPSNTATLTSVRR
ncbi:MAG TPA: hypothetical protein VFR86_00615, partial [Burkholderiaceae bacterium]|nr:hypothetical protein [Burkholderiaceae bacterium]